MKHNKKVINLLAALAVAVPMTAPVSNINSVFAETVEFTKQDEGSNEKLAGATYAVYEIGGGVNNDKLLFSVSTKADGKLDASTLSVANGSNKYIKEDGNIDLPAGSYYAVETKAPEGYMVNVKHETFTVTSGGSASVSAADKKFPSGKGQAVVISKDKKTDAPISGATFILQKKDGNGYKDIAALSTDDNGYLVEAAGVEMYNGTLVLPEGQYLLKEQNVPGNYAANKGGIQFNVTNGQTSNVPVLHEVVTDVINPGNGNSGNAGNTSNLDKTTGVKIRIMDSNNKKKPISGIGISVYSVDKNGKENLVFDGKTNSDGYLSTNGAKTGGNLVHNNVLYVGPGKYYYKLSEYPNSQKHEFTVQKGKIGDQILQLNMNGKNGSASNKKKSSKDSSKLAKTGTESTVAYTAAGMALISAGAVAAMRKKKESR